MFDRFCAQVRDYEAANHITQDKDFDQKKWRAARNKHFNFAANAGRTLSDEAMVASYLAGTLAKGIQ